MAELLRDYFIKITGTQEVDGDKDRVVVETTGHYEEKGGVKYIYYKEYYDDESGDDEKDAIVKIEPGGLITIIRDGEYKSQLMLELDRQHQCFYQTPYGDMLIKVYTSLVDIDLGENGGRMRAVYSLNFNGDFGSENEFIIELKRIS